MRCCYANMVLCMGVRACVRAPQPLVLHYFLLYGCSTSSALAPIHGA